MRQAYRHLRSARCRRSRVAPNERVRSFPTVAEALWRRTTLSPSPKRGSPPNVRTTCALSFVGSCAITRCYVRLCRRGDALHRHVCRDPAVTKISMTESDRDRACRLGRTLRPDGTVSRAAEAQATGRRARDLEGLGTTGDRARAGTGTRCRRGSGASELRRGPQCDLLRPRDRHHRIRTDHDRRWHARGVPTSGRRS